MNIATFPERNKGRRRRCRSMEAAGFLSLLIMERDGEAIPENVERFDGLTASQPSRSPELLFGLLIWSVLTVEQQDSIRSQLRGMVYCSKEPNPYALQLHNMLEGGRS